MQRSIVIPNIKEVHLELKPVRVAFGQMKLLHHTKVPLSETRTKDLVGAGIAPSPRLRWSKRRRIEPLDAVHRVVT